jgi:DivIVA domain-containing protein
MPFAPHEIEKKRFVIALRGYQTDEVDAFLRAVAADYRAALEQASGDTEKSEAIIGEVERVMASALEQAKQHDGRQEWISELQRLMQATTEELRATAQADAAAIRAAAQAEAAALRAATEAHAAELQELRTAAQAEAAEIRTAATADATQIRATAHAQANVGQLRAAAQAHAREVRLAAETEIAELRAQAEAEIAAARERAEQEASEIRTAAFREAEAAYAEITRQAEELRRLESSLWNRINVMEHTVVECRQALAHVSNLHPMQPNGNNGNPLATNTLPTVDELLYRVEAASLGTETNADVSTADL